VCFVFLCVSIESTCTFAPIPPSELCRWTLWGLPSPKISWLTPIVNYWLYEHGGYWFMSRSVVDNSEDCIAVCITMMLEADETFTVWTAVCLSVCTLTCLSCVLSAAISNSALQIRLHDLLSVVNIQCTAMQPLCPL